MKIVQPEEMFKDHEVSAQELKKRQQARKETIATVAKDQRDQFQKVDKTKGKKPKGFGHAVLNVCIITF